MPSKPTRHPPLASCLLFAQLSAPPPNLLPQPHVTLMPHPGPRLPGQPQPGRGPLRLGLSPHGKCSPSDGGLSWNGSCLHQLNKALPKLCPLHQTRSPPRRGQCLPALRSGPGAPQAGLSFPPHAAGPLGEWGFFAPSGDAQSCLPLLSRPRRSVAPHRGLSVLWGGCRSSPPAQARAGLGVPGPRLSRPPPPPQIYKGARADERVQWHLPEGAAFSWLPHPERTLEGRGSLAQRPGPAQQHPHIPPRPVTPTDLGS